MNSWRTLNWYLHWNQVVIIIERYISAVNKAISLIRALPVQNYSISCGIWSLKANEPSRFSTKIVQPSCCQLFPLRSWHLYKAPGAWPVYLADEWGTATRYFVRRHPTPRGCCCSPDISVHGVVDHQREPTIRCLVVHHCSPCLSKNIVTHLLCFIQRLLVRWDILVIKPKQRSNLSNMLH